jgi:glycosyltransferase involved in cell wall biosynthesis
MVSAQIDSLPADSDRPLWSVMIPNYNCPKEFLIQALESVLAQDLGPEQMQIELIDDRSTLNDPEVIVEAVGRGRIGFYRQPTNARMVGNFNTCIRRSRGHLIHILHADDYVAPDFYRRMAQLAQTYPEADLYTSRAFEVDEASEIEIISARMRYLEQPSQPDATFCFYENPFRTPAVVVRRRFYEQFGGFCDRLEHTCDWEMWTRVIKHSSAVAINQPLAYYRRSGENNSSTTERSSENLRDWARLRDEFAARYADFNRHQFDQILKSAAFWQAFTFIERQDETAARLNSQLWWSLLSAPEKVKNLLAVFLGIDRSRLQVFAKLI